MVTVMGLDIEVEVLGGPPTGGFEKFLKMGPPIFSPGGGLFPQRRGGGFPPPGVFKGCLKNTPPGGGGGPPR